MASAARAGFLIRGYRQARERLLLWASLCFVGLALNSILLFVDLIVVPAVDLTVPRGGVALAAMVLLLYGVVWELRP
ncbi:MAG TPA: DUF5985 family protein [Myxococcaceae bacterium]|jgi:hypothetical protein